MSDTMANANPYSDDLYNKELLRLAGQGDCRLDDADVSITHDNPLCGDRITIDLKFEGTQVKEVGYKARACALCKASAELIKELAPGTELSLLQEIHLKLKNQLKNNEPISPLQNWEKFNIFQPVTKIKNRHTCILLPFQALAKIERNS